MKFTSCKANVSCSGLLVNEATHTIPIREKNKAYVQRKGAVAIAPAGQSSGVGKLHDLVGRGPGRRDSGKVEPSIS